MKTIKIISLILLIGITPLVLQGCSWSIRTSFDGFINSLIKKDQEKQQWFVVSREEVYAHFDQERSHISMRSMELKAVPDFCELLKKEDHKKIKSISLQDNEITLVNQDLSCLVNLEIIDLSYNQVSAVRTLGELPSLTTLKLNKNKISSLVKFPDFPALENLSLSFNNLKNTAWIENLKNLVTLELAHNQLEELVGIENMERLEALKVEFNKLKELDGIRDLKNLEFVSAARNELKDTLLEELNAMNKKFLDKVLGGSQWGTIDGIPVIDLTKQSVSGDVVIDVWIEE